MKPTFIVDDPLASQEVTLIITLPASEVVKEERPLLLTVGIHGEMPLSGNGQLDSLPTLIDNLWTALSVRVQLAQEINQSQTTNTPQQLAVIDVAEPNNTPEVTVTPKPNPETNHPPQSPARNLSLF